MAFLRGLLALPFIIGTVFFSLFHIRKKSPSHGTLLKPAIELPLYAVAFRILSHRLFFSVR